MAPSNTVWVLGDQLNRSIGALADADPATHRVLMVENTAKLASKRWHRHRAHFVLASMRRFASELADAGFEVDDRRSPSLRGGFAEHVAEYAPDRVVVTEPASIDGLTMLRSIGAGVTVEIVRSNQFLCHYDESAEWAGGRTSFKMEDFYRWQRRRLGYLMDADGEPVGGRWNFDDQNRQPLPKQLPAWPTPQRSRLDDLDREVVGDLPDTCWGVEPDGTWATSRRGALARLRHFVATTAGNEWASTHARSPRSTGTSWRATMTCW